MFKPIIDPRILKKFQSDIKNRLQAYQASQNIGQREMMRPGLKSMDEVRNPLNPANEKPLLGSGQDEVI